VPDGEIAVSAVIKTVQALLLSDALPDCQEFGAGRTTLMFACNHGKTAVARLLLAAGADAKAEDSAGFTPLHCAGVDFKAAKHRQLLSLLLEHGANMNASTEEGFTPLAYLAQQKAGVDDAVNEGVAGRGGQSVRAHLRVDVFI
jgi:uncharacterized protein